MLKSIESFNLENKGLVFVVESPVFCARKADAMKLALGPVVNIDGLDYEPIGFEWHLLNTPVTIGEKIGILVSHE